jgi:glycosyltransferase involved in cell wall biosynthesis
MKLAIISHTEHYLDKDGSVAGWGPTVREINYLATHFDKIYHVACLHEGTPPPSSLEYVGDNIEFVPIPPSGGNTFMAKLSVLRTMPLVIRAVNSVITKVDYFQLRLPTGMGTYLLPWLIFKKPKARFWVKYAGNWAQENPPFGYAFQRWFLKKNYLKCRVTINGHWPGQPSHILSFENPCLTEEERIEGVIALNNKNYGGKLNFIFVGRVEEDKGVGRIIEAFRDFRPSDRVGKIRIIGDGPERKKYERLAARYGLDVSFLGFQSRLELNELYKESHVLLLPSSASEGFPKVIAEGANYGCIPIVSDISCLSQYIQSCINGFVLPSQDVESIKFCIIAMLNLHNTELKAIAIKSRELGSLFTYDFYSQRIKQEILLI